MTGEHRDEERQYFLEQAMDESEPMDDSSLTNTIGETYVGTVLKRFSRHGLRPGRSKTPYMAAIGKKLFGGRYEVESAEERIENEKTYRERLNEAGFDTPEIVGEYREYLEFERIDATSIREYLSHTDEDETKRIGEYIGNALRTLHDDDYAITDFRISNILVEDDGTLVTVDHEYATDHATDAEKNLDLMTLISSARQFDPEIYHSFRDGFEDGYGEPVDRKVDIMSAFSSRGHAIWERDKQRRKNAKKNFDGFRNTYRAMGNRIRRLVRGNGAVKEDDGSVAPEQAD